MLTCIKHFYVETYRATQGNACKSRILTQQCHVSHGTSILCKHGVQLRIPTQYSNVLTNKIPLGSGGTPRFILCYRNTGIRVVGDARTVRPADLWIVQSAMRCKKSFNFKQIGTIHTITCHDTNIHASVNAQAESLRLIGTSSHARLS